MPTGEKPVTGIKKSIINVLDDTIDYFETIQQEEYSKINILSK